MNNGFLTFIRGGFWPLLCLLFAATLARAQSVIEFENAAITGLEGSEVVLKIKCDPPFTNFAYRTVTVKAHGGTAKWGEDFTLWNDNLWPGVSSVPLSFEAPPDEHRMSGRLGLLLKFDALAQPDETVVLTLQDPPAGAILGRQTNCVVTIKNLKAQVGLDYLDYYRVEEGQPVSFQVNRQGDPTVAFSVAYRASGGTAVEGRGYEPLSGILNFAAGEMAQTFTLKTIDNGRVDFPVTRTVAIQLDSPTDGVGLGQQEISAEIRDNEFPAANPLLSFPREHLAHARRIDVQSDGRIVIATAAPSYVNEQLPPLIRLNIDGSLDPSYHPNFERDPSAVGSLPLIRGLWVEADNSVVIQGSFRAVNGELRTNGWARVLADGSVSPDLGNMPWTENVPVVHRFRDGRVLVNGLRMFSANGTEDPSFDSGFLQDFGSNWGRPGHAGRIAEDLEGRLIGVWTDNLILIRIRRDGSVDPSFKPNWGDLSPEGIGPITLEPDGKILVRASGFLMTTGEQWEGVIRLDPDGVRDRRFAAAGEAANWFGGIAFQEDGRILIETGDTILRRQILRLQIDGSLDRSFAPVPIRFIPREDSTFSMDFSIVRGLLFVDSGSGFGAAARWIGGFPFSGVTVLRLGPGPASAVAAYSTDYPEEWPEGDEAHITVRRLGESLGTARVSYSTRDGTAKAGRDYAARSGTIEFGALEVDKTLTIPLLNNGAFISTRTFELVLGNPLGIETVAPPLVVSLRGNSVGLTPNAVEFVHDKKGQATAVWIRWDSREKWIGDHKETIKTRLESSADLRTWMDAGGVPLARDGTGILEQRDELPVGAEKRFYRLRVLQ